MFDIEKIKKALNIKRKIFIEVNVEDCLRGIRIPNVRELYEKQKELEKKLYDTESVLVNKEELEEYKKEMYDVLVEKVNRGRDDMEMYNCKVPKLFMIYTSVNLYYTDILNNYTKLVMNDACNSKDYVNGVYCSCSLKIEDFSKIMRSMDFTLVMNSPIMYPKNMV